MKKRQKKFTLLKGEGVHQHTLYGDFGIDTTTEDYKISVDVDSLLKHEHPNGSFGEHETLTIEKGKWVMGKQVEFNPFDKRISRVWD
jgi:hypothetical protein